MADGPSKTVTIQGLQALSDGELKAYEVDGEQVAVARVGDEYFAFGDVCTHAQCSLSEGFLEGKVVTCPCHGSQFDVSSGEVRNPPAVEPVRSYKLRAEGDRGELEV